MIKLQCLRNVDLFFILLFHQFNSLSALSLVICSYQESESEGEGIDEADDDNEEEHEQEPDVPEEKEPIVKKPAEIVAPKESERQLSKKELKKKELAELEAMLAEFGLNKAESNDDSQGNLFMYMQLELCLFHQKGKLERPLHSNYFSMRNSYNFVNCLYFSLYCYPFMLCFRKKIRTIYPLLICIHCTAVFPASKFINSEITIMCRKN